MSQHMRFRYLSHRRPAMAQASLRICAVSPKPSLFTHMKSGSRGRVRPKIRHLAPLDGCACATEEWITEDEKCQNLMSWLKWVNENRNTNNYEIHGFPNCLFNSCDTMICTEEEFVYTRDLKLVCKEMTIQFSISERNNRNESEIRKSYSVTRSFTFFHLQSIILEKQS